MKPLPPGFAALFGATLALFGATLLCAQQLSEIRASDIRVDVNLVVVPCSVTDRNGAPVRDLTAKDFILRDDGQPSAIRGFWRESDLPLTIALVADVSQSQAGFVKDHREAVIQFLKQVIGPRDRAMVVTIDRQARLISDLTGPSEALSDAVLKIGTRDGKDAGLLGPPCRNDTFPHSCGGTALWHGLYYAAKKLQPVSGRKAIVVLSDGIDSGSDIHLKTVIELAQSAGTLVYSIKYATPMRFLSPGAALAQAVSHGLDRLSAETGGLAVQNPGRKTTEVFDRIETDLRNLYVLGFAPPTDAPGGVFHKLEVKTVITDFVVRSRAGYWTSNTAK
jgi:VWFA-related protein